MTEWQPIETAPKDGTSILAFGSSGDYHSDIDMRGKCAVVWWDVAVNSIHQEPAWRYCSYDSGYYGWWLDPTHWQPLPEPPKG